MMSPIFTLRIAYSMSLLPCRLSPWHASAHMCSGLALLAARRFREIADANGSLLMCDMAHISGLVATGEAASPFEFCDVVTTTTHKSLRGPRAGMIFFKKDAREFEKRINAAVFPATQGGPHEHQIAAIATQLKEVVTPEFKAYCAQLKANSRALAAALIEKGYVYVVLVA